ncbi:MAG: hypothetical protein ACKO2Q_12040, partial [Actinomycetota bacterium]
MADVLFATDGRDRAAGALASTAASLRGLGFTRRTWYVSTHEPLTNRVIGRRLTLGDDQSAEWVVFVTAGDTVTRDALHFAARAASDVDVIYGDTRHDIKREDRLPTYQRRPSFSPERLRSHNYIGELVVARRRVVDAAGGLESLVNTDAHDRNLRLCEHARRVVRVPEVLNVTPSANFLPDANPAAVERHLARVGITATVEFDANTPRVRVRRSLAQRPLISVIIPTRGSSAELRGD